MDFNLDGNYLLSSLLISCVGAGCFMYGKKAQRLYPLLGGIALCAYPFFVTNLYLMWGIAVAIFVLLFMLREK